MFKFELGQELKEVVTGFRGMVMGRTDYYTGCNHYGLLSKKLNKAGAPTEWQWFDETRLTATGKKLEIKNKKTSGIEINAPEM